MSHRRHFASKIVAIVASVAMLVTGFAVTSGANAVSDSSNKENLTLNRKGVIVTAFQQNWNSIAKECTKTYGPEGVKYVQVSPPNDHVKGSQWWTSYQPVSYKLDSKLGTEGEFKQMIQTCKAAKIGIIADAVINHMTGAGNKDKVGVGGSEYDADTQTFKTAGYTKDDFHQSAENINNYKNAEEVWTHRLVGLLDLDTSKPHVQQILGKYFAYLLELGVVGFRVDAVKHISPADMAAIKKAASDAAHTTPDKIWWMQETIGDPSEATEIQPDRHLNEGEVNEFQYSYRLKNDFYGSISNLKNITNGLVPSDKASIFVTNWDTPRENFVRTLTYKDGPRYELANAFMLGYPYGNPNIYSGYRFANGHKDDGAPGASETSVSDVDCSPTTGWQCTQRWTSIRGMVGFFNAVNGAQVTNWQESDNNNIAFSREKKGFLAINNTPNAKRVLYKTDLPNGEYCNVYAAGDCSKTVKVEDGKVAATIAPYSAIALHVDATTKNVIKFAARNESDPKYVGDVKDQSTTVYFNAKNKAGNPSSVNIHYQISGNNWTVAPGLPMHKVCGDWFARTIPNNGKQITAVFNDGGNNWYNNNNNNQPKANFEIQAGSKTYVVDADLKGSESANIPCKVEDTSSKPSALKTKIVIHYKQRSGDNRHMGVYMWGLKDADGQEIKGAWHAFNGQDAFGKTYTVEADGTYESGKVGFIIVEDISNGWNDNKKDGGNRNISQIEDGVGEAWVYGGDSNTFAEPPSEVSDKLNNLKTLNVTVHYRRTNKDYAGWNLWTWYGKQEGVKRDFTAHDDFGKIAEYTFTDNNGVKDPKFIVRYSMQGNDWVAKDPGEGDRAIPAKAITLSSDGKTGNAEIWLMQGDSRVYLSPNVISTKSNAINADITSLKEFTVNVSGDTSEIKKNDVTITDVTDSKKDQHKTVDISQVAVVDNKIVIVAKNDIDIKKMYEINIKGVGGMPRTVSVSTAKGSKIVRTDEFDKKYAYTGDDLGAVVKDGSTTFKLWAPTATKVELVTYSGTDENSAEAKTQDMKLESNNSVWSITTGDAKAGTAYTYKVHFADGAVNNSPDPYAKAAVRNGMRSVVFGKDTGKPVPRMASFDKRPTDATIAEMNIRDFSIHESSGIDGAKRGKYLGVIESDAKKDGKPTGFDYLKSLGITHVQIMPMYDFGSVNEAGDLSYGKSGAQNWGYDPINYNVPEGSYASDSANPVTRIAELKQMVDGLHKAGLRVIMDVVYNHVYNAEKNAFGQTVPGYYFRYNDDGSLTNGSGCGNDTASERKMMRKYIVDSVKYWAKEYGIDGFRFDLMGLIDLETIKEVREAVHAIDPNSIILGEGWDMSQLPYGNRTIQPNAYKLAGNNGVAFFNDSFRDAVKGQGDDGVTGFVSGNRYSDNLVMQNLYGCQPGNASCTGRRYANAGQTVQYVEAHDNLNLYDKLKKSLPNETEENLKKRVMLANSLVMFAHGMPFFELGQEFLRSKNGNANSYNAGDGDNSVKWDLVNKNSDAVEYFKALIKLRNEIPALRDSTYSDVNKNMHWIKSSDGINAFSVDAKDKTYVFIFNANDNVTDVNIGKEKYRVRIADGKSNGDDASKFPEASVDDSGNYKVAALSTAVLVKDAEKKKDENPIDLDKVSEYKLHPADVSELVNGTVNPAPEPSPAPGPHPEPQPGPQPQPQPGPGPVTPTPQPPAPAPVVPTPAPGPVNPAPQPSPAPGPVTPAPVPSPAPAPVPTPQPQPSENETPAKPDQTKPDQTKPDQSKPDQSKTETPAKQSAPAQSGHSATAKSEHSNPAKPAESVTVPVAPETVQQLNPELKGTLSIGNNNVATAGVVNTVSINVVNSEFIERLQRDGVVYAYAYIYSSPRLLKGADGSKFVTVRMVNGKPQFDAQFPAGYSGKHTVVLVDEKGNQVAWTDITVTSNAVSQQLHSLSATGSNIFVLTTVCSILIAAASVLLLRIKSHKRYTNS